MTDRHTVTTAEGRTMFRALHLLEKVTPPNRYDRPPYWKAPVTPASEDAYTPTWAWYGIREVPAGAERMTLDTNGAYLGAAGGVTIAHSHLTHRGEPMALPEPRDVLPGYYRIAVPHWAFSGTIVSPLGDSSRVETEDTLWVAHPTLILLLELLEEGALGDLTILDSYTAQTTTSMRAWVARLKEHRTARLDALALEHPDGAPDDCTCEACESYGAFKDGYSAALSMMLTGQKCRTHRPDWTHAVLAQHAASQWRKACRITGCGVPVLAMGHTDELTIFRGDLDMLLMRPKP